MTDVKDESEAKNNTLESNPKLDLFDATDVYDTVEFFFKDGAKTGVHAEILVHIPYTVLVEIVLSILEDTGVPVHINKLLSNEKDVNVESLETPEYTKG